MKTVLRGAPNPTFAFIQISVGIVGENSATAASDWGVALKAIGTSNYRGKLKTFVFDEKNGGNITFLARNLIEA